MRSFKDNLDEEWTIDLNSRKVFELRSQLGIDLLNPDSYMKMLESRTDQICLLCLLCEKQSKERGIDVDEFESRLHGEGISQNAVIELLGESEIFFRNLGETQLATLAKRSIAFMKLGMKHLQEMTRSGVFEKALDQVESQMEKERERLAKLSQSIDGDTSLNSQQSPE